MFNRKPNWKRDAEKLYKEVLAAYKRSDFADKDADLLAVREVTMVFGETSLFDEYVKLAKNLIEYEQVFDPPKPGSDDTERESSFINYKHRMGHLKEAYEHGVDLWIKRLRFILIGMEDKIPKLPEGRLVSGFGDIVDPVYMTGFVVALCMEADIPKFRRLADMLVSNAAWISEKAGEPENYIDPEEAVKRKMFPKDVSLQMYLSKTPLYDFFAGAVAFSVPMSLRAEHTHIVGGTGHGKTQLLETLILEDIEAGRGVCVIDSQRDLIKDILSLQVLKDREVALIDPIFADIPPCLNLFDVSYGDDPSQREKIYNGTVAMFENLFGGILGAELTSKQRTIFKFLSKLMLAWPGATIKTLLHVLTDKEDIDPIVQNLDSISQSFFEDTFNDKAFVATKQQIAQRLWDTISNESMARMFLHEHNKVDFFEAMNSGKIVLVNTAKDLLQQEGTQLFGRFFVLLILQAALKRLTIPREQRRPFMVYIDECHDYLDSNIEIILAQARKMGVHITLAHQFLKQLSPEIRASVMANTSVKFAGGLNDEDTRYLGREFGGAEDLLRECRKQDDHTQFALWLKGSGAMMSMVAFGAMDAEPQASKEEWQALIDRSVMLYGSLIIQEEVKEREPKKEQKKSSEWDSLFGEEPTSFRD